MGLSTLVDFVLTQGKNAVIIAGIFMLVKHGVGGKIGKIAISLLIIGLAWYVLGDPRKPLDALAQLVGKVFGGK